VGKIGGNGALDFFNNSETGFYRIRSGGTGGNTWTFRDKSDVARLQYNGQEWDFLDEVTINETLTLNNDLILSLDNAKITWPAVNDSKINTFRGGSNVNFMRFNLLSQSPTSNVVYGFFRLVNTTGERSVSFNVGDDSPDDAHKISVSGETFFNEQGNELLDFRIEGDTEQHLFFVNASTDRIGIGTATPTHELNVVGDVNITGSYYGDGSKLTGISSSNPFDQDLNTTNSPTFNNLNLSNDLILNSANKKIIWEGVNGSFIKSFVTSGSANFMSFDIITESPTTSAQYRFFRQTNTTGNKRVILMQGDNTATVVHDLRVDATTVWNEQGNESLNFRIEGDTEQHLFFVDASTDRIGIGTATPEEMLDINGSLNVFGNLSFLGSQLSTIILNNSDSGELRLDLSENDITFYRNAQSIIRMRGGSNSLIRIGNDSVASDQFGLTIRHNGRIGIGTTNPTHELNVVGDINITGSYYGDGSKLTDIEFNFNQSDIQFNFNQSNIAFNYNQTGLERNIFDQDLNTTSNVVFNTINGATITTVGVGIIGGDLAVNGGDIISSSGAMRFIGLAVTTGTLNAQATTITGDLTVDLSTLKVDSTNNRIGIGTVNPTHELNVVGDINLTGDIYGQNLLSVHTNDGRLNILTDTGSNGFLIDGDTGLLFYGGNLNLKTRYANDIILGNHSNVWMTIKDGGNVGIGITTPAVKLQVGDTDAILIDPTGTAQLSTLSGNAGGLRISSGVLTMDSAAAMGIDYNTRGLTGGRDFTIQHDGTAVFTIEGGDNIGNVGIGTNTPTQKLQVVGDVNISEDSNNLVYIDNHGNIQLIAGSSESNPTLSWAWGFNSYIANISLPYATRATVGMTIGTAASYPVTFYTGGSQAMHIGTDGDVGIGTINPIYDLHVNRSGDAILALESKNNGSTSGIQFIRERKSAPGIKGGCIGLDSNTWTNNAEIFMDVDTSVACGQSFVNQQRFSINSNGNAFFGNLNVGIGTTTPDDRLEVVGNFSISEGANKAQFIVNGSGLHISVT